MVMEVNDDSSDEVLHVIVQINQDYYSKYFSDLQRKLSLI